MKNINISIFCVMVIATSVFGSCNDRADESIIEGKIQRLKAELELKKLEAEKAFRQCLINHSYLLSLRGSFEIPKVCEDAAIVWRVLGGRFEVDEFIKNLKNNK